MAYDKRTYDSMPRKFGTHIVVDVRTGATYESYRPFAEMALLDVIEQAGEEEYKLLSSEDKQEIGQMMISSMTLALTGGTGRPLEVLSCGPYQTITGHVHEKNMDLLCERFMELARGGERRDGDGQLADWIQEAREKSLSHKARNDEEPLDLVSELEKIFGGDATIISL